MIFRIDNRDRVAAVSDEWAQLARETGVDALFPGAEVGKPWRKFMRSNQVAQIYKMLIDRIRLHRDTARFPVRADSAREHRYFSMEMEVVGAGDVEFRLALDRTEPRAPGDWAPPPEEDEMIRMCSFCHRAQWDLEWMELEEAIRQGDLLGEFKHWKISHGSCPDCLEERMKEIQGG